MAEDSRKKVLVIDDQEIARRIMSKFLSQCGYDFDAASNGAEGIEKARKFQPDLIYLDLIMPDMDGYETCRILKQDPVTSPIPVIVVTSSTDKDARLKALECGANDFINKPDDPAELMARTKNLLKVKEYADFLKEYSVTLDSQVRLRAMDLNSTNAALKKAKEQLKESYVDTVQRLTLLAEHKDKDTALHIKRVSYLCVFLAEVLGFDSAGVETIFYASPMHDIGKVAIPSEILLKPGRLTMEEFALMKTHTTAGANVLKGSNSQVLLMAARIAQSHHERFDGGGYPQGLKGEDIPLEASIMNIVDQYDALRSARPYKPSFGHGKVFETITEGDGRTEPVHFNRHILAAFKDVHRKFAEIYEQHTQRNEGAQ